MHVEAVKHIYKRHTVGLQVDGSSSAGKRHADSSDEEEREAPKSELQNSASQPTPLGHN